MTGTYGRGLALGASMLTRGKAAGGVWFGFSFRVGTVPMKAVSVVTRTQPLEQPWL